MNKIELIKTAMANTAKETYTFEAEMFDRLEEDKTITFARFFEVDDTLQVYEDCSDYLEDIETVEDAEDALRMRVKSHCAVNDYSTDCYQPEDF